MKRRTVLLSIEIEGAKPDALSLRDHIIEMAGTESRAWSVVHAEVVDPNVNDGPVGN